MHIRNILPLLFISAGTLSAQAEVKLNAIFTDHMVLQRDIPAKIYGTADAGEQVTVQFGGQSKRVTADAAGKWTVALKPMTANATPQSLQVGEGEEKVTRTDILVGDVWLCTGQSNMANPVKNYKEDRGGLYKEFDTIPGDYKNDLIRIFTVPTSAVDTQQDEILSGESWQALDPDSALTFSCTGYFFGRHLQPEIGVPLGLLKVAYGGTAIETWLPMDVMQQNATATKIYLKPFEKRLKAYPQAKARYDEQLAAWRETKKGNRPKPPVGPNEVKRPAAMYNGMVHPLHKLAVKGAIWYQGENEANYHFTHEYQTTFPLLIDTWRERWGQGNFPFVFVQLAGFRRVADQPTDTDWARQRESQLMTLDAVKNTRMVVAIDGGVTQNIHPPYKDLIGQRLTAQVLSLAYGCDRESQGPMFTSMKVNAGQLVLSFDHLGSGLMVKEMVMDAYGPTPYALRADELKGFAVAGADQVFHWADAIVEGNTVVVHSAAVTHPVAVRYAWADFPLCNLYNKEGFAAVPFRTDDWPMR